MIRYSNNILEENRILIITKFLFLSLPLFIVSGNFLTNFLPIYSFLFLIYLFIRFKVIDFFWKRDIFYISIFFFYLVLNLIINFEIYIVESTLKYTRFFFYTLIIIFLLSAFKDFEKKLTTIFFFVILIVISDGIFQYIFGYNTIGLKQEVSYRVSGYFGDELILGSFISKYLPFFFIFFIINKKYDFFLLPLLVVILLMSFLTGERTAFFTSIILSLIIILKIYNLKKILLLISSLILILTIIIKFDENIKERMINSTIQDTQILKNWKNPKSLQIFTNDHNAHFQSAYLMYKKGDLSAKLFGRGVKSFRLNCSKREFCDSYIEVCCSSHPHNIFLQTLSEIGLVGLFIYLYFLLYLSYNSILLFRNKYENKRFIINASILINYLPFLPSGNIFGTFISANFFILLSFLIYLNNQKKSN
jgi:O-antigen ligase